MTNIKEITIDIPKADKTITIDFAALPDTAKLYYATYGVKQALNDAANVKIGSFIRGNTGPRYDAAAIYQKVLDRADSIATGNVRQRSGGDRGRAERIVNIAWMKSLKFSVEDMKAHKSDSEFVISCYVAEIANRRQIDRADEKLITPLRTAAVAQYEKAVEAQIAVITAQRAIAAEAPTLLDFDLGTLDD